MKLIKDLKINDTVWTIKIGLTKIKKINETGTYSIVTEDLYTYTKEGRSNANDTLPSLFTEDPLIIKESFIPRFMLVSEDNISFYKRWVITKTNKYQNFVGANGVDCLEKIENWQGGVVSYKYGKEINNFTIELTLEDIAKKFNVNASEIRIKD